MMNLSDMRRALPDNLLVVVLIVLVLLVNLFFVATAVLPRWQNYEQLSVDIIVHEEALSMRLAEQDAADMKMVLQAQVETARSERDQLAYILLTPQQAGSFVERLYGYAAAHGVEIVNLQAQEAPQSAENGAYEVRVFRLQASGHLPELVEAIAGMHELSAVGLALNEIYLDSSPTGDILTMTIAIYASTFSSGSVFNLLPQPEQAIESSLPNTPLHAITLQLTPVFTTVVEETMTSVNCLGTLPSPFRKGDTVVVDFHHVGALRILEGPSGFDTLTQVYDGTQLQLLDGPICGTWRGENIFYWFVEVDGMQGWAGEGDSKDRWICPLADPDCAW